MENLDKELKDLSSNITNILDSSVSVMDNIEARLKKEVPKEKHKGIKELQKALISAIINGESDKVESIKNDIENFLNS